MTIEAEIKIARSELFAADVDRAIARQRALTGRTAPEPEPVSLLRRVLLSSMFYLPLAGLAFAMCAWLVLEPYIGDYPHAAGQVVLINSDPFDARGMVSMTIGDQEVLVDPDKVYVHPGARGQPPFESIEQIQVGTVVEATGTPTERHHKRFVAISLRPASAEDAAAVQAKTARETPVAMLAFFPLTATLISVGLLLAEVISRRNWSRLVDRCLAGSALAMLFSVLAFLPAGFVFRLGDELVKQESGSKVAIMVFVTCRSIAWAALGAGLGVGMNLTRSTRAELRNTVVGGAIGGAFGGLFFDPITWLIRTTDFDDAHVSRAVGVIAIGLAVGAFVALLERLTREAWVRVRTGPLAGKSFILYRTPTIIGSSPSSDIYLFKDAAIDAHHASIHRVGQSYEIEDQGSRGGTLTGGQQVRRRRLVSGDQIVIGSTVLEFEERARRPQDAAGRQT